MPGQKRKYKRYLISAFCAFVVWLFWHQSASPPAPATQAVIYASQCDDDLRAVFQKALQKADHKIDLQIYSLTEPKLASALQKKADAGLDVQITHDAKTNTRELKELDEKIERFPWERSGLMHKKILVTDDEGIWISSANWTRASLKFHDNLVVALNSPAFAKAIAARKHFAGEVGGQKIEYWDLPTDRKAALTSLTRLLRTAQKTVRVAMFTFTHQGLTDALIAAHKRGVDVEVVIDRGQANIGKEAHALLAQQGVALRISQTEMCHHKFALIDDQILVHGSANWTKAAFTRNAECLLIVHALTRKQRAKLHALWRAVHATSVPPLAEAA